MSNKQQNQYNGIDVDADETPEQSEQRKVTCAHLIIFVNEKIKDIENDMLDAAHTGSLPQRYQQALTWSNISQWLNNIMANRWILPEQAKRHKAASELKPEDKIRIIES